MHNLEPWIKLLRVEENFKYGTFGNWIVCGRLFCVTLEPADLLNAVSVSSIPAQQYTCERYSSLKYPDTFQIMNVPGRTKVLMHAGNVKKHTEGCVILASEVGKLKVRGVEQRGILNSGHTFRTFMQLMDGVNRFRLSVVEHY